MWEQAGKGLPTSQLDRLDEEFAFVVFHKKAPNSIPLNLLKSDWISRPSPIQPLMHSEPQPESCFHPRVIAAYKIINKASGQVSGYGVPDGPTYGELTMKSMQVGHNTCLFNIRQCITGIKIG